MVAAWDRLDDEAATPKRAETPGRPRGSETPIDLDTFWTIFRMAVEGASARRIARASEADAALTYINKAKAGVIVKWVAAHPAAAKHALGDQIIPKGFLATPDGVFLPKP